MADLSLCQRWAISRSSDPALQNGLSCLALLAELLFVLPSCHLRFPGQKERWTAGKTNIRRGWWWLWLSWSTDLLKQKALGQRRWRSSATPCYRCTTAAWRSKRLGSSRSMSMSMAVLLTVRTSAWEIPCSEAIRLLRVLAHLQLSVLSKFFQQLSNDLLLQLKYFPRLPFLLPTPDLTKTTTESGAFMTYP